MVGDRLVDMFLRQGGAGSIDKRRIVLALAELVHVIHLDFSLMHALRKNIHPGPPAEIALDMHPAGRSSHETAKKSRLVMVGIPVHAAQLAFLHLVCVGRAPGLVAGDMTRIF